MKKLKSTLKWVLGGGLLLALATGLYLLLFSAAQSTGAPRLFGFSSAVVVSGSMSGTLEIDDMIFAREREAYRVGDVVTFQSSSGSLVTHRIVEENAGVFTTKGDANNAPDADPLQPGQIVGEVVLRIPGAGRVVQFIRTPLGLSAMLGAAVLLAVALVWPAGNKKKDEAAPGTAK